VGLEEEAVVGAEPPDDGVREVVGRRGLGLGGLAVGRAVHDSTWRVVRAEELAKDDSPESRKRDTMVLARGGSAREEAETVSGAGERRLDATRAHGYWLAAGEVEAETRLGLFARCTEPRPGLPPPA
jgi:hypothetical protein